VRLLSVCSAFGHDACPREWSGARSAPHHAPIEPHADLVWTNKSDEAKRTKLIGQVSNTGGVFVTSNFKSDDLMWACLGVASTRESFVGLNVHARHSAGSRRVVHFCTIPAVLQPLCSMLSNVPRTAGIAFLEWDATRRVQTLPCVALNTRPAAPNMRPAAGTHPPATAHGRRAPLRHIRRAPTASPSSPRVDGARLEDDPRGHQGPDPQEPVCAGPPPVHNQ
jgi:hypothetical protein